MISRFKYHIDQSGKVEDTARTTVIALSNETQISVILKSSSKHRIQTILHELGKPQQYILLTFSALLAITIKTHSNCHSVTIDTEYLGHNDLIKEKTLLYLKQLGYPKTIDIRFGFIGKRSPAHILSALTAHHKRKPAKIVTATEVLKLILTKKDRVLLLKKPGTV
jgi:hypothetical protein